MKVKLQEKSPQTWLVNWDGQRVVGTEDGLWWVGPEEISCFLYWKGNY